MIATCMEPLNFSARRSRSNRSRRAVRQRKAMNWRRPRHENHFAESSLVMLDARDMRQTAEQITRDHSFAVRTNDWLDLTAVINFYALTNYLRKHVTAATQIWIDTNTQRSRQAEWLRAQQTGWIVKLPVEEDECSRVKYIKDRIGRATHQVRSGQHETVCLMAHSDCYAREARQFCKAGGRLLLIGFTGYFQRRLYELTDIGAVMMDLEYDCQATNERLREPVDSAPQQSPSSGSKKKSRFQSVSG